ncbi:MAG: hypothetical protein Edafosvirus2_97 [Edafosvirus sp.]|uniref:Uncharacterized protein n=1 Tax=Edafosvirus sp. TaxID=2487765 RepID=A0A3G4ZSQ1_9VIRU|nr:MAG: hypothetical protein Edafosvirus2_97 [Edafosvirus sp.]
MIKQAPDTFKQTMKFLNLQEIENFSEVCKFTYANTNAIINKYWNNISKDIFNVPQDRKYCISYFNKLLPTSTMTYADQCMFQVNMTDKIKSMLFIDAENNKMSRLLGRFIDMVVIYTHMISTSLPDQKYYIVNCDYINKEIKFVNIKRLLASVFFQLECCGEFIKITDKNLLLDDYIKIKFGEEFKKSKKRSSIYKIPSDIKSFETQSIKLNSDTTYSLFQNSFVDVKNKLPIKKVKLNPINFEKMIREHKKSTYSILTNIKDMDIHTFYSCNQLCNSDKDTDLCTTVKCKCEGCLSTNGQIYDYANELTRNVGQFVNCLTSLFDFNKFQINKKIDDYEIHSNKKMIINISCKYGKKFTTLNHAGYRQNHFLLEIHEKFTIPIEDSKAIDEINVRLILKENTLEIRTSYGAIDVL